MSINRVAAFLEAQPHPVGVMVCRFKFAPGRVVSAIVRFWSPGDPERCKLCSSCTARDGVCLIQVRGEVPSDRAALYSTRSLREQR